MTCNNNNSVNTCWLQANWSKASNQNDEEEVGYEKIENNINYGNPNTKLINCIVNNIFNVKSIVGSDSRLIDKTTNLKWTINFVQGLK
jgi:hypothetical protein